MQALRQQGLSSFLKYTANHVLWMDFGWTYSSVLLSLHRGHLGRSEPFLAASVNLYILYGIELRKIRRPC